MSLRQGDVDDAIGHQRAAARDARPAVRLVGGPGTGKSASIEERFGWLIETGASLRCVYGVSFTRAAARDLRLRAGKRCLSTRPGVSLDDVRVSTLHSLALSILQRANLLTAYPVRPLVLHDWEVENLFDAEFRWRTHFGKKRAGEIRKEHEAFGSTGEWDAASYIQPDPPISAGERASFAAFYGPTTQTYACVLPGQIVRACVTQIEAGLLSPAELMDMRELIVDEYQDLNPMDLRFVDALAADGARLFVAGDDDQSIYSFRFASPAGIQDFIERHAGAGDHVLTGCFRSATNVVAAGNDLIAHFSEPRVCLASVTFLTYHKATIERHL